MASFWQELSRRNVFKVGVAYAIVAWLLAQVIVVVETPLGLPDWADSLTIILLIIGFPVALIFAWAFELTPAGIQRTDKPGTITEGSSAIFTAEQSGDPPSTIVKETAKGIAQNSIAVLPFANLSSDPEQEYFADGMTEELLNSLARIKDLQVTGRTSCFYFKGKNEDLRTIGEMLGVEHILEGSVRKSGERVRITAQLINARSNYHLWSETYDRMLDDLFVIQEDIAKSVAEALEITLGVGARGRMPGMTHSVAAYDEFLKAGATKGLDIVAAATPNRSRAAIHHLQRAVGLDPDFGLAWAGLFTSYGNARVHFPGGIQDGKEKSQHALERALELTPDSPMLLSQIAYHKAEGGEWLEADRLQRDALAAAARYSLEDHFNYRAGLFLHNLGRISKAIDYYEKVRVADPLNINNAAWLMDAYSGLGNHAAALAEADRLANVVDPQIAFIQSGALLVALATRDRSELDKRLHLLTENEGDVQSVTAKMQTLLDKPTAACAELHRLATETTERSPFALNIIATWAAYFDDPQLALDLFREVLITQQTARVTWLIWRSVYAGMRKLDGFKDLLRDLGLVGYWRTTGNWGDLCRPLGDDDFECE